MPDPTVPTFEEVVAEIMWSPDNPNPSSNRRAWGAYWAHIIARQQRLSAMRAAYRAKSGRWRHA